MSRFTDLSGTKLPGLTVIRRVNKPGEGGDSPLYECMKDDGTTIVRSARNIRARAANNRRLDGNRMTDNGIGADGSIIRSVSDDQSLILKNILILHAPNGIIDLDATYNRGCFYKDPGIDRPKLCFDIEPLYDFVQTADARSLPVASNSISCAAFDPPFLVTPSNSNVGVMCERYGSYKSIGELYGLYADVLAEFFRILIPGGIMIFKCQDVMWHDKQYFSHVYIANKANDVGFYAKDLFVLATKTRPVNKKQVAKQVSARKYHSYFWVFQKPSR